MVGRAMLCEASGGRGSSDAELFQKRACNWARAPNPPTPEKKRKNNNLAARAALGAAEGTLDAALLLCQGAVHARVEQHLGHLGRRACGPGRNRRSHIERLGQRRGAKRGAESLCVFKVWSWRCRHLEEAIASR